MTDLQQIRVYDNGGRSFDRYTVFMPDGYALGIGDTGNVPNGFCMTVDAVEGPHLGEQIGLADMTDAARKAVEGELLLAARLKERAVNAQQAAALDALIVEVETGLVDDEECTARLAQLGVSEDELDAAMERRAAQTRRTS